MCCVFVVVGSGAMVVVAFLGFGLLWCCFLLGAFVVFDSLFFFFFFFFVI